MYKPALQTKKEKSSRDPGNATCSASQRWSVEKFLSAGTPLVAAGVSTTLQFAFRIGPQHLHFRHFEDE